METAKKLFSNFKTLLILNLSGFAKLLNKMAVEVEKRRKMLSNKNFEHDLRNGDAHYLKRSFQNVSEKAISSLSILGEKS